jgi:hypothetical protein
MWLKSLTSLSLMAILLTSPLNATDSTHTSSLSKRTESNSLSDSLHISKRLTFTQTEKMSDADDVADSDEEVEPETSDPQAKTEETNKKAPKASSKSPTNTAAEAEDTTAAQDDEPMSAGSKKTKQSGSATKTESDSSSAGSKGAVTVAKPTFYFRVGQLPKGCPPVQSVNKEFKNAKTACGQNLRSAGKYGVAIHNGKSHCGKEIVASYKGKSVKLTVVDACPGCAGDNHLDMSLDALQELFGGKTSLTCAINTVTPKISWKFTGKKSKKKGVSDKKEPSEKEA